MSYQTAPFDSLFSIILIWEKDLNQARTGSLISLSVSDILELIVQTVER